MRRNKNKKILLTGASGHLGKAILGLSRPFHFLYPGVDIFDITKPSLLERYFKQHKFDAIINCAALARMGECEKNPLKAVETNIIGTANLVMAVINMQDKLNTTIRFIHISTDGVYPGKTGNYAEKDRTIPYNIYGWTKLAAECAVNLLSDFCIIRTSFFDPKNIRFDCSATDLYSSKLPINYLAKAILTMLESCFIGTINIGGKRQSDYDKYKKFKPSLKRCKGVDILKNIYSANKTAFQH
ncbi:SDR family oxidoreductase, partial [Candidatus Omnitrophota bacterium]